MDFEVSFAIADLVISDLGHGKIRYTLLPYRFSLKLEGKKTPCITAYTGCVETQKQEYRSR